MKVKDLLKYDPELDIVILTDEGPKPAHVESTHVVGIDGGLSFTDKPMFFDAIALKEGE